MHWGLSCVSDSQGVSVSMQRRDLKWVLVSVELLTVFQACLRESLRYIFNANHSGLPVVGFVCLAQFKAPPHQDRPQAGSPIAPVDGH